MATPELTGTRPWRALALSATAIVTLTAVGVALGMIDPGLAGTVAPHPGLHGTVADAVSILITNLRELAGPFLLIGLGWPRWRSTRICGDVVVGAIVTVNGLNVGVQLGRWQGQLVPYLPQLPVEWAAIAVAAAAWISCRHRPTPPIKTVTRFAAATVGLLLVAATLETFAVPHLPCDPGQSANPHCQLIAATPAVTPSRHVGADLDAGRPRANGQNTEPAAGTVDAVAQHGALPAGPDVDLPGAMVRLGLTLQGRTLPSPHCVRFRFGLPALSRLVKPTPGSHKEGSTC